MKLRQLRILLVILLTTGCAKKPVQQKVQTTTTRSTQRYEARPAAPDMISAVVLPCANDMNRNAEGNCPKMQACPVRCIVGAVKSNKKSCWNYYDTTAEGNISLSRQRINGNRCAWSY